MNRLIIGLIFVFGGAAYFETMYIIPLCLIILFLAFLVALDKFRPDMPADVLKAKVEMLEDETRNKMFVMEEKLKKLHNRININT